MLKRLLLLLILPLSSCSVIHYDEQTKMWVCFLCGGVERSVKSGVPEKDK